MPIDKEARDQATDVFVDAATEAAKQTNHWRDKVYDLLPFVPDRIAMGKLQDNAKPAFLEERLRNVLAETRSADEARRQAQEQAGALEIEKDHIDKGLVFAASRALQQGVDPQMIFNEGLDSDPRLLAMALAVKNPDGSRAVATDFFSPRVEYEKPPLIENALRAGGVHVALLMAADEMDKNTGKKDAQAIQADGDALNVLLGKLGDPLKKDVNAKNAIDYTQEALQIALKYGDDKLTGTLARRLEKLNKEAHPEPRSPKKRGVNDEFYLPTLMTAKPPLSRKNTVGGI